MSGRTREAHLRQHAANRCANAKAERARRIDVTLCGESLDDYETVRGYIEHLNRWLTEHAMRSGTCVPLVPLSDNEIISRALSFAAFKIQEG